MHSRTTHILIPKPFSLKATALSHGWHECSPMSWCEAGECLQVIERIGNMPVRLSMIQGTSNRSHVRVGLHVEAAALRPTDVSLMRRRAAVILRRDLDLREFHALACSLPKLMPITRMGAGRILRTTSMTESIIKTQCAANVNWTQAVKMINRIGQLGPCLAEFRSLNAWPTPREILAAGEDYLQNVARVGYRAKFILEFCRSVTDGSFDADALDEFAATHPTDDVFAHLLTINGIGPAGASFLLSLLGHFGRMSIDSWTLTYVGRTYMNGRKPTVKQVEKIYKPYGEWRQLVWWFEQWLHWGTAQSMV